MYMLNDISQQANYLAAEVTQKKRRQTHRYQPVTAN